MKFPYWNEIGSKPIGQLDLVTFYIASLSYISGLSNGLFSAMGSEAIYTIIESAEVNLIPARDSRLLPNEGYQRFPLPRVLKSCGPPHAKMGGNQAPLAQVSTLRIHDA